MFGARLCTGSVDAICQRASEALAGPHISLREWVLGQHAVHVDETGWRTAGDSRALCTMTTPGGSLFEIAERCNREQFDELIGPFSGIIVSDRWPGYEHLDPHQRQACWSHLQRDFRRHSEGLAEQQTFGEHGLQLPGRVSAAWRACQHEHHDRPRLQADVAPIQTDLRKLLEDASRNSKRTRLHRRFANNLLKVWPALWTFTTHPAVEPTNNPAERALRGPVIHRKLSHGTRSDDGERFAERALSAAATCRQHNARCSTSSPNCSPPTPAAIHSPRSSEPGTERLRFFWVFRDNLGEHRALTRSWRSTAAKWSAAEVSATSTNAIHTMH
jgi:transposase